MLTRQLGQGKSPRAGHMWTERFWQETPGSGPMPLPCFIVLRNSFWAWCWARQCAIWQLCVGRPNLGTLALQELQNSSPVKFFIERWSFEALQWTRLLLTLLSGQCKTGRGGLPFQASSLVTCHLWSMLRPWGCPRFATTNLIGVKNVFLRCNLRMRSWLRWNTSSCLTWGQNFLQAFCGRRNETCFLSCLELLMFANRDKYRDWVGCRLMFGIAAVILEGHFFFGFVGHVTTTWHRCDHGSHAKRN